MTPSEGIRTHLAFSQHLDALEEIMNFRLTYEGELMARGGGADHKHEVRKVFHAQLRRLWDINPILAHWGGKPTQTTGEKSLMTSIADSYSRFGYRFVPLATQRGNAVVSLDILFLRSGQPGAIMRSADLDGRLKTLIDALRLPHQTQEVGQYVTPAEDENPFFCLMDDDRLVGNISVCTDMLLQPTPGSHGYHDTHDSRVVIAVGLKNVVTGSPWVL